MKFFCRSLLTETYFFVEYIQGMFCMFNVLVQFPPEDKSQCYHFMVLDNKMFWSLEFLRNLTAFIALYWK